MTLVPKQFVGQRYQITQKMGEGSFGETYLAKDNDAIGREVLVKRFRYPVQNQMAFLKAKELFFREAEVLLQLSNNPPRSDQIPQFYAFFERNQEFYLVEEFIKGKTLREELREKIRLTEDEVVNLLLDLLEVLKFIHSKRIIHRDIKPENIILRDADSKPVIIDFGSVKEILAQSTNYETQTKSTVILTPGYAPLEQFQGKPEFNSDIYALGMTALEALTGLEPEELKYQSTSSVILFSRVKISNKLGKIIEKMLDKDCSSRYQSASEVLVDLKKVHHTLVIAPKKSLSALYTQPTTSQLPKSLVFVPLGMVMVAGVSFFAVRGLVMSQSGVSNSPLPGIKETPANSMSNEKPNISAPVESSPDSNLSIKDSGSLIRFKRANTPGNSTDGSGELKPQPNATEPSSDSSEIPIIRFKRSH
ncbi:hypothetical protein RIVM261_075530 [Rivularia sp. IAM M-261]|nr:hypothetical protein RIVM261_075530 [Rivularia sp. IAM M-261]